METERIGIETALLAGLCSDRYLLAKAIDEGFRPELLHSPAAKIVATALGQLRSQAAGGIDLLLVRGYLEQQGLLAPQLVELLETLRSVVPPPLDRVMAYIEFLKERSSREELIQLASNIDAYARQKQHQASVVDFTGTVVKQLLDIQKQRSRKRVRPVEEMVHQIAAEAEQRPKGQKSLLGYSLAPYARLNEVLSGLRPGFYYGLAGAPRRGKTNFALQLATSVASNHPIPVLFYSWEQTRRVLAARLMGKESGLNPTSLLSEDIASMPAGVERLAKGLTSVQHYERRLFLLEGTRQDNVDRIRATAYNLMHEFRTDSIAIFLDYLQKIPVSSQQAGDARARIDEISTALADLSLELSCPVFAISSIDKEGCRLDDEPTGEERFDEMLNRPRPTMHNCTGSGDIEYDLDVAMILSKDWKASKDLEELLKSKAGGGRVPKIDIIDLHIDKNRDAPAEAGQSIQYAFFVHENRFVEIDYKSEEESKAEFRGFAKVQEIFAFLVEKEHLQMAARSGRAH